MKHAITFCLQHTMSRDSDTFTWTPLQGTLLFSLNISYLQSCALSHEPSQLRPRSSTMLSFQRPLLLLAAVLTLLILVRNNIQNAHPTSSNPNSDSPAAAHDAKFTEFVHRIFKHKAVDPVAPKPRPFPVVVQRYKPPPKANRPGAAVHAVVPVGSSSAASVAPDMPRVHQAVLGPGGVGQGDQASAAGSNQQQGSCPAIPGAQDILIVLLVDAADVETRYELMLSFKDCERKSRLTDARLPAHVATTLSCTDSMIFAAQPSEAENLRPVAVPETIGSHRIHTATGTSSTAILLPALHRAFETHDQKKWFFVLDAKSYVSLGNLLLMTKPLDPSQDLYTGATRSMARSIDDGKDTDALPDFVTLRSGILLSHRTAQTVARSIANLNAYRTRRVEDAKYPPYVALARLLRGNRVAPVNDTGFHHNSPRGLRWRSEHWCTPAVSWRLGPVGIQAQWEFEKTWFATGGPSLLGRDVYAQRIKDRLTTTKEGWDNLSQDWVVRDKKEGDQSSSPAVKDAEGCSAFCEGRGGCVQWHWRQGYCAGSERVRLGHAKGHAKGEAGKETAEVSGWMMDKIRGKEAEWGDCQSSSVATAAGK